MPIILAIEPDRRQRQALGAVVHERVGAELIIADTTEHALEAIGNRMPDLVLVPALLSPQDDAALAAALRVIAAAAHVRTLTIPVLASEAKSEERSGLLSRWRRGRNSSSTGLDGCDPHVFAEQISAYLAEAAAERAALLRDAQEHGEAPYAGMPIVDPAILTAAIVEAVSMGRVDDDPVIAEYQFDERRPDEPSYIADPVAEHAVVEQPYVEYPAVAMADAIVNDPIVNDPIVERIVEPPYAEYPAMAGAIVNDAIVERKADYEFVDAADAPAPILVADEAREDEEVVEVRAEAIDGEDDFDAEEDIDLSNELASISDDDADAGSVAAESTGFYAMPSFDDADLDVSPFARRRRPAFRDGELVLAKFVAERFAPEEVVEELVVEVVAAPDETAVAASRFGQHAAEDRAVEDFLVEELAADGTGSDAYSLDEAADNALADEPGIAPHVLEARAAFEHAEILALAEADDAVLTEFERPADTDVSDVEPWAAAALNRPCAWPALEGIPAEIVIEPVRPEPVRAAAPVTAQTREREWTELVASLRQDIERRRVEPQKVAGTSPMAPMVAKRPSKKAKPVQDEWGFFDPEQCGFAALLAKLDEITDAPDERDAPRL